MQINMSPQFQPQRPALAARVPRAEAGRIRVPGRLARALILVGTLWALACGTTEAETECEACLESGGTWQVVECTRNCALQDGSCYRDACPVPCAADSCGTCFSQSDCEAVDCAWHAQGEALWCTASS